MKYNPPLGGGANDSYVDGNQGTGVEGAVVPAAAIEDPQREIMAIIAAAAGLVGTDADLTQLLQAVKQLFGGNLSTIAVNTVLTAAKAGLILVDATAGNVAITLPAAATQAMLPYDFLRVDASANTVTIAAAGADLIDQAATFTLVGQNAYRNIRADGVSKWRSRAQTTAAPLSGHGECQLQFVDATHIALMPIGGGAVKVAGTSLQIPGAGVTITNAGLGASAVLRGYLFNNAGAPALELSATASAIDTTAGNIGVRIKAGDNSRTLVGLFQTDGASHFQSGLLLRSYFNRGANFGQASSTGSTVSATPVKIGSGFDVPFVCFADDLVIAMNTGYSGLNNNSETDAWMAIDAATVAPALKANYGGSLASFVGTPYSALWTGALAEGLHTGTLFGNAGTGGTASFAGTTQVAVK
jgi:hypothetical protein